MREGEGDECGGSVRLNEIEELMLELASALDDTERLLDRKINDEDENISGVPSTQYLFIVNMDFCT